jgi:hypothetical protein
VEKNWSERFEKAQPRQRTWRVFLGAFILIAKIGHIVSSEGGIVQRLDLWPLDNSEAIGYDFASVGLWILAAWLIASGVRSRKVELPPETK